MKIRKIKFISVFLSAIITATSLISFAEAASPKEFYYKGENTIFSKPEIVYTESWKQFWFFGDEYVNKYILTNCYRRCLSYYIDGWISNQGQTLSVSKTKTITKEVSAGVKSELGVSGAMTANLGANFSASVSTTYSSDYALVYDLSKFSHQSYNIAAMGFYDKFNVSQTKNGKFNKAYTCYAYDVNSGYEIRLVYRY